MPGHYPIVDIMFRSEDIMSLKFPLSCHIVEKCGFGRGGHNPDFGHAFSNRTHFRVCDQFWLSSVQQARRVADEEKKEESVVNPKSADNYVGRPKTHEHK